MAVVLVERDKVHRHGNRLEKMVVRIAPGRPIVGVSSSVMYAMAFSELVQRIIYMGAVV